MVVLAGPYATMVIDPLKITLRTFIGIRLERLPFSLFGSFAIKIGERL
jgi:hypothetical protein